MDPQREINNKDFMYWETTEHNHTRKTSDWYWVVGIIALAFFVSSILFGNYTFSGVVLLATVALFLSSHREPEHLKIGMDGKGIYINKDHYPYETIHSFYIEDDFGVPRIFIKSKKILMPLIVIPLGDIERDDVEFFLGYHLDNEKIEESLFQIILEYFGF